MSGEQVWIPGGQEYEYIKIWSESWFTKSADIFTSMDWEGYMGMFSIQVSQIAASNRKQS